MLAGSDQELQEIRSIERAGHRRRQRWLNDKVIVCCPLGGRGVEPELICVALDVHSAIRLVRMLQYGCSHAQCLQHMRWSSILHTLNSGLSLLTLLIILTAGTDPA